MKFIPLSTALAVSAALAIPLGLVVPASSVAKDRSACEVGSPTYPTIQNAVDAPNCAAILLPMGVLYENVTIQRDVTITGRGHHKTAVDGSLQRRPVFWVSFSPGPEGPVYHTVVLEGMTIRGGAMDASSGPNPNGGGISAQGTLTVNDCRVSGNVAAGGGGGITVFNGTLNINGSEIVGNSAYDGGAVRSWGSLPGTNVVTVTDSVIANNVATQWGGGITFNRGRNYPQQTGVTGKLVVRNSVISGNSATAGGGIFLDNATISTEDATVLDNAPDDISARQPSQWP